MRRPYLKKTPLSLMNNTSYKLPTLLWECTMAVAFSVICRADLGKRLTTASPLRPFVWKRFIDDIFSLWYVPMEEVFIFVNFASFYLWSVIRTCYFSRHRGIQRTSPFKSQTHFKPTETFQYTHFSSCHRFNTKKGFIKREALRLLRTNSVKENFNKYKDFEQRLCNRGYQIALVHKIVTWQAWRVTIISWSASHVTDSLVGCADCRVRRFELGIIKVLLLFKAKAVIYCLHNLTKILTEVQLSDRTEALRNKTKKEKEILPFVTTYDPATLNLKKILMKHWHIIQKQPKLALIFNLPSIVSYRKEKSLKDILVRAKLPSIALQS